MRSTGAPIYDLMCFERMFDPLAERDTIKRERIWWWRRIEDTLTARVTPLGPIARLFISSVS